MSFGKLGNALQSFSIAYLIIAPVILGLRSLLIEMTTAFQTRECFTPRRLM
jgi:hypothetical protein